MRLLVVDSMGGANLEPPWLRAVDYRVGVLELRCAGDLCRFRNHTRLNSDGAAVRLDFRREK